MARNSRRISIPSTNTALPAAPRSQKARYPRYSARAPRRRGSRPARVFFYGRAPSPRYTVHAKKGGKDIARMSLWDSPRKRREARNGHERAFLLLSICVCVCVAFLFFFFFFLSWRSSHVCVCAKSPGVRCRRMPTPLPRARALVGDSCCTLNGTV
jgi:hypothetical protein